MLSCNTGMMPSYRSQTAPIKQPEHGQRCHSLSIMDEKVPSAWNKCISPSPEDVIIPAIGLLFIVFSLPGERTEEWLSNYISSSFLFYNLKINMKIYGKIAVLRHGQVIHCMYKTTLKWEAWTARYADDMAAYVKTAIFGGKAMPAARRSRCRKFSRMAIEDQNPSLKSTCRSGCAAEILMFVVRAIARCAKYYGI